MIRVQVIQGQQKSMPLTWEPDVQGGEKEAGAEVPCLGPSSKQRTQGITERGCLSGSSGKS